MKNHTKVYMTELGYDISDFIPCEICFAKAVDIHHIKARGMGGSNTKDSIENLMALCRQCHNKFGDIKEHLDYLIYIHNKVLVRKQRKINVNGNYERS